MILREVERRRGSVFGFLLYCHFAQEGGRCVNVVIGHCCCQSPFAVTAVLPLSNMTILYRTTLNKASLYSHSS